MTQLNPVRMFDYIPQLQAIEAEVMQAISAVLYSGKLILGPETARFETAYAQFVGAKQCIGVSSGTTAIQLALMGLGIGAGDEVITVANTCVPTVAAIELTGATPIFVDVEEASLLMDVSLLEDAITDKTKAIVPVHLWGQAVDMAALMPIAKAHNLFVVEDCAQAHGTQYRGQHVGTIGDAGCFSFYPTKNLGAYGDAGGIVTNRADLADTLRLKRFYGYKERNRSLTTGMNARINEMQAAILRVKLAYLADQLAARMNNAARYNANMAADGIQTPYLNDDAIHSYHQYVIRCDNRETIIAHLQAAQIGFGIHYPISVHQMEPYAHLRQVPESLPVTTRASKQILSLPVHEALQPDEVERVIATVNQYEVA